MRQVWKHQAKKNNGFFQRPHGRLLFPLQLLKRFLLPHLLGKFQKIAPSLLGEGFHSFSLDAKVLPEFSINSLKKNYK